MAEDTGSSSSGSSSLPKALTGKVGGVPVWGIGVLFAALLIGVLWYRNKNKANTPPTGTQDTTGANVTDTSGTQTTDPIAEWMSQNPTSPAYPVVNSGGLQTATPITNEQWSRLAFDELAAKGNDPTLLSNAISKYLQGQQLSAAEQAVINLALSLLGAPPEGVLPVNPTPTPTPTPTTAALGTRKDQPSNHAPITYKVTENVSGSDGGVVWHGVAQNHYTLNSGVEIWRAGDSLAHYNAMSGLSNPHGKTIVLPYTLEPL